MYNQKTNTFQFDSKKTLEALIFVTSKVNDLYRALKILYEADLTHLSKYGRFIAGDTYIAMKNGAVPSVAYDIAKLARGDGRVKFTDLENSEITDSIKVENNTKLIPQREPNLNYLSETDIECLNQSIEAISKLNKEQLWKKFHEEDKAYVETEVENDIISIESIASLNLENGKEILEHLSTIY